MDVGLTVGFLVGDDVGFFDSSVGAGVGDVVGDDEIRLPSYGKMIRRDLNVVIDYQAVSFEVSHSGL